MAVCLWSREAEGQPGDAELRGNISKLEKSAGPDRASQVHWPGHTWHVLSF